MRRCEQRVHEAAAANSPAVGPPCNAAVHEAIGLAIQLLRRERGHTQEALALKAGIDLREMAAIEYGQRSLTIDTLVEITTQLDISVYVLLRRAGL